MSSGIARLARAVLFSAVACAIVFIALVATLEITRGRAPRIQSVAVVALLMMSAVALSGAVIQWPLLRLIRSFKRPIVIGSGAVLGIFPLTILGLFFGETLPVLIRFWRGLPGEFFIGFLPMAVAGGVLGWFVSMDDRPTTMFGRFDRGARRALFYARFHAAAVGESHIQPEHLLNGLLREKDAGTIEILRALHVDVESLCDQCRATVPLPNRPNRDASLSISARRIVASAVTVADDVASSAVVPYCLLLAIVRDGENRAAQLLSSHGVNYEQLVERVRQLR